jgi:photosystem II stability/assembly factor-like uncharacterized protein
MVGMQGVRRSAGVVFCAALLGLFGAAPAFGASWDSRELPSEEDPRWTALHAVSCPSASLCVAVGEDGVIASSTKPRGSAADWQIVRPYDLAVETDEKCYSNPEQGFPTEIPCPPPEHGEPMRGVSCPSVNLCVAVTSVGYVYSSTDPTGPASSWRVADIDDSRSSIHLEAISCPDPGFCVAVSGKGLSGGAGTNTAGKVLTTTEPTGPGGAWQVTQLDPSLWLRAVSCSSRSYCVAVAKNGQILESKNPAGGAAAWSSVGTPGGPGNLESITCVDQGLFLCLAGNSGGNFLATKGAGGSTWSETNGGASVPITGISCPTPSRCAAVDNNGDVLVSADPAAPRSWSVANLIPFTPPTPTQPTLNALFGVSCPNLELCVLVGVKGLVFTSTDPFAVTPPGSAKGQAPGSQRRLVKRPKAILVKADGFREMTRRQRLKVRFRFYAKTKVQGFVCKRDQGRYRPCRSPQRYWVPLGRHVLRVRAVGPTGLRGPVARIHFEAIKNPNF